MNFRSAIAGLVTVVIGASGLTPGFASAENPTATVNAGIQSNLIWFEGWHGKKKSRCVGFEGGHSSNAVLQISDCSDRIRDRGVFHHQKWVWVGIARNDKGEWDTFAFRNTISDTCISVENNSVDSGAVLVHQKCNYTNPSQLWMTTRSGDGWLGDTKLVNVRSGKCTNPGDRTNATFLQQWDCSDFHYFKAILERV